MLRSLWRTSRRSATNTDSATFATALTVAQVPARLKAAACPGKIVCLVCRLGNRSQARARRRRRLLLLTGLVLSYRELCGNRHHPCEGPAEGLECECSGTLRHGPAACCGHGQDRTGPGCGHGLLCCRRTAPLPRTGRSGPCAGQRRPWCPRWGWALSQSGSGHFPGRQRWRKSRPGGRCFRPR